MTRDYFAESDYQRFYSKDADLLAERSKVETLHKYLADLQEKYNDLIQRYDVLAKHGQTPKTADRVRSYVIARAEFIDDLETEVNVLMDKGYMAVGTLQYSHANGMWVQAMMKDVW